MNIIETVISALEDASFTEKAAALNALVDAVIEDSEKARESMGRNICLVPIKTIKMFHEHPFYIDYDEDMEDLVRSIAKYGQITPGAVRYAGDGEYELLSGHRRLYACKLAGIKEFLCEILDLSDDDACIYMIEANRQRTGLKLCEKGDIYRLKKDLIDRKEGRTTEIIAEDIRLDQADTKHIIKRLLRLEKLIPDLREMVDDGEVSLRSGYELSFLPAHTQCKVIEFMDYEQRKPSHEQCIRMRKLYSDGKLTPDIIGNIISEDKHNQKAKITITNENVISRIPEELSPRGQEEYIEAALKYYEEKRRRG